MRTRIKVCGITRVEDALCCAQLGADAIGLMFYQQSPRAITMAQAQKIIAALPPYVSTVGIFVNAPKEDVTAIIDAIAIQFLQFHGDESAAYCESFLLPYIKTIHMKTNVDLKQVIQTHPKASGLLLDTFEKDRLGGTGKTFDWTQISKHLTQPIILAGGLNAQNIQQAIKQTQPFAVDVNSGVETSPGIKDQLKLQQFFSTVDHENGQ